MKHFVAFLACLFAGLTTTGCMNGIKPQQPGVTDSNLASLTIKRPDGPLKDRKFSIMIQGVDGAKIIQEGGAAVGFVDEAFTSDSLKFLLQNKRDFLFVLWTTDEGKSYSSSLCEAANVDANINNKAVKAIKKNVRKIGSDPVRIEIPVCDEKENEVDRTPAPTEAEVIPVLGEETPETQTSTTETESETDASNFIEGIPVVSHPSLEVRGGDERDLIVSSERMVDKDYGKDAYGERIVEKEETTTYVNGRVDETVIKIHDATNPREYRLKATYESGTNRLLKTIRTNGNFEDTITTYSYTDQGLLAKEVTQSRQDDDDPWSDFEASYTYDSQDRLVKVTSPVSVSEYDWANLTIESKHMDANGTVTRTSTERFVRFNSGDQFLGLRPGRVFELDSIWSLSPEPVTSKCTKEQSNIYDCHYESSSTIRSGKVRQFYFKYPDGSIIPYDIDEDVDFTSYAMDGDSQVVLDDDGKKVLGIRSNTKTEFKNGLPVKTTTESQSFSEDGSLQETIVTTTTYTF